MSDMPASFGDTHAEKPIKASVWRKMKQWAIPLHRPDNQ
jgi:hypothetical protein